LHAATRVLNAEADEGAIHTECQQLAIYTLIPVLPVALATMPLAELSARLLKPVF